MKYLWKQLMPFATDSTGVVSLFADSGALIIGHDPRTTVGRNYGMVEPRMDTTSVNIGLWSSELAYSLGDPDYFVNQYLEQIQQFPGRLVVLVHSPVSSLTNLDFEMLASEVKHKLPGVAIFSAPTSGNSFYDRGLSDAFVKIAGESVKQAQGGEGQRGGVNILGLNALDFPSAPQRDSVKRSVAQGGQQIVSIYGVETDLDRMHRAGAAERNIVASVSGLDAARLMRDALGIPFIVLEDLTQLNMTIPPIGGARRALIIGEQFTSNALRRKLLDTGAKSVTVASFFTMDSDYMRDGDAQLDGEDSLRALLAEQRFDAVIGDSAFAQFVGAADFFPIHHPAVSGAGHDMRRGGGLWRGR
jgi:hypothetical protein